MKEAQAPNATIAPRGFKRVDGKLEASWLSTSAAFVRFAALGSTVVPRAIRMFREEHPHVTISLTVASSSTVRDHVAGRQVRH